MSDIVTLNGYKIKDEKAVRSYDNVALMKADTKLKEGYQVKTKGYEILNDGKSNSYFIRGRNEIDIEDGENIIFLNNGNVAEKIKKYIRKFTPKIFYSVNWAGQSGGVDYTASDESRQDIVNKMKESGFDGFILPIQTKWNSTTNHFEIINDLDDDLEYALLSASNKVPLHALKIHHSGYDTSTILSHQSTFISDMKLIIDFLYNKFSEVTTIEYLTILNELTPLFIDSNNISLINDLLNYAKGKGYKTGITSAGANYFNRIPNDIIENSDILAINQYVRIGSKRENTTINDSIVSWNNDQYNDWIEYYQGRYRNKKFIISETGCKNYWEALQSPSSYNFTSEEAPNDLAQLIYYEGMFNQCKYVDEVWLWFEIPNVSIFNKYLRGEE